MKNYLFFLNFILLSFSSLSQNNDSFVWSEKMDKMDIYSVPTILSDDEGFFYKLDEPSMHSGDYTISKHDSKTMSQVKSATFQLRANGKPTLTLEKKMIQGKFAIISYQNTKKPKGITYYLQFVDPTSLSISKPIKIAQQNVADKSNLVKNGSAVFDRVSSRPDNITIVDNNNCIVTYLRDLELGAQMKKDFFEKTYSFNGTKLGSNFSTPAPFNFKAGYDFATIHGAEISKDGILYLAANEFKFIPHPLGKTDKRYKNRKAKDNSNLCLIAIDLNTNEMEIVETELSGNKLKNCKVLISESGEITFIGQTGADYFSVDGYYSASFSNDLKVNYANSTKYDQKLASDSNSEELKNDGVQPFTSLNLDHVFQMNDGTYISVCEQRYEKLVRYNNTSTTTYFYNDILVSKFDKSGKNNWTKRIEKRQKSKKDQALNSSYEVSTDGTSLTFFFNKFSKENLSDVSLAKVEIDADGTINTSNLGKLDEGVLIPKSTGKQSNNRVILYFQGESGDRFAKFEL